MDKKLSMALMGILVMTAFFGLLIPGHVDADLSDDSVLSTRGTIRIDGDSDFTSVNGVTGGDGTLSNPYIIENWRITPDDEHGITILGTESYFIIRNCWIDNGIDQYDGASWDGIVLYGLSNGRVDRCLLENDYSGIDVSRSSDITISNNTCVDNMKHGIRVTDSDNIFIDNNTCSRNQWGIYFNEFVTNSYLGNNICERNMYSGIEFKEGCHGNIIEYNTCIKTYSDMTTDDRSGMGIRLRYSSDNVIRHNICNNNSGRGIFLDRSHYNEIFNNTLSDNIGTGDSPIGYGIILSDSRHNELDMNTLANCGISLGGNDLISITTNAISPSNTVNGLPLKFISNSSSSELITGNYGQMILMNCENKTIQGLKIQNVCCGIQIWHSSSILIESNEIKLTGMGLEIHFSDHITVQENIIKDSWDGIIVGRSHNVTIENNTLINGKSALQIYSDNTMIRNNRIFDFIRCVYIVEGNGNKIIDNVLSGGINGLGVHSAGTLVQGNMILMFEEWGLACSYNSTIKGNYIMNNGVGITMGYCDSLQIEENVILGNGIGIRMSGSSSDNEIMRNNISQNSVYGIEIDDTRVWGNRIHANVFYRNNGSGVQAFSSDSNNDWDNGSMGNYWSDYKSRYVPPATNDGIVWNVSYRIDGAVERDRFPLVDRPVDLAPPPVELQDIRIVTEGNPHNGVVGREYSVEFAILYSGIRSDLIEWSFDTNASWLSFDESHTLKGTPIEEGFFWVNISVTDGVLSDHSSFTINTMILWDPPVISTIDVTSIDQWEEYHVDYDVIDDFKGLEWHLDTPARFLVIDEDTGVLSGTPGLNDIGMFFVNVSVFDGNMWSVRVFYLTVNDANDPPMMNSTFRNIYMDEDATRIFLLSDAFFNHDGDPLVFSAESSGNITAIINETDWLSVSPAVNWFGNETLFLNVSDGHYDLKFSILIIVSQVNDPPTDLNIQRSSIGGFIEGEDQIVTAEFFDPDLDDSAQITWYVDGVAVSSNVSYNLSLPSGTYILTLRVTDSYGNYSEVSTSITVRSRSLSVSSALTDEDWFPWFILLSVVVLILCSAVLLTFIYRRRRVSDEGQMSDVGPIGRPVDTGTKRPGSPHISLEVEVGGLGVERDVPGGADIPWYDRSPDDLEGLMQEVLDEDRCEMNCSSLMKRLKSRQLDGELSIKEYEDLMKELGRIGEE